ncbi:serine/threonine-protein kinase [Paraliomyxa miuraensis]|uniref:serine/threonine-protein kinase n=1 Tax=Paraliomyxa miuraensis TaxID=376150 RepID=UPI00225A45A1|nr:serine/threonine-protein kinase [Paraliomyxa miuraensis]MCX4243909.1 tetratricopeptide repeat protein [Paraliomyxa miuraensis]
MYDEGEATLAGDETDGSVPAGHEPAPGLDRGARLGRYTVLELLGRGGMGLVYAAYDPELDRRVAVKVLRSRGKGASNERAALRLLREAQAMAKLSHPNVVTVHDVGTTNGEVFLAMEFVDGPSLDRWLADEPRGWAEVIGIFADAGRGLAAAHAAGLVHRDFKPANVLVDRSGRARVTDFGLAHVGDPSLLGSSGASSIETSAIERSASSMAQTIGLVGTPAYMAPEQHAQLGVDARTDQFGFCVALYEALFHLHPFGGDSVYELASAVTQGSLREVPSDTTVPAHVRRAVLRGLARAPEARWPSMEALLAALLDDPARRRRRWVAGAAIVTVGGGAVVVAVGLGLRPQPDPAPPPCTEAGAELDRVWTPERRAAIGRAFDATGQHHAPTVWARSAEVLERYATRWRDSALDACEATRVRGEQSDSLFDLRRACLERRLHELDARLAILAEVDGDMLDHSIDVASSLTPIDVCEDTRRLTDTVPLPEDPAKAEQVEALLDQLETLDASITAGRAAQVIDEVDRAVEQAVALGHAPTRGHARILASSAHEDLGHLKQAEQLLLTAAEDAAEGRDDRLVARAWSNVPYLVGYLQGRADDAVTMAPAARAALARVGRPDGLVVVFEQGMGTTRFRQGDLPAARHHYEQALALLHEDVASAEPRAHVLNNLGVLSMMEADYAAARDQFEASRAARAGLRPPEHPDEADYHQNLGNLSTARGDYSAGLKHYDQALAIIRAVRPEGPEELLLLTNRSQALTALHRTEQARADLEQARALAESLYGSDHPVGYTIWGNRAHLEFSLGRLDEARVAAEHAIALGRAALGSEHKDMGVLMIVLGAIELRAGNFERANEIIDQATALIEGGHAPDHPEVGLALRWRGAVALEQGQTQQACEFLERATTLLERGDPQELAYARFDLARCLPPGERARARRLAEQARERLRADQNTDDVAAIDRWLARNAI